MKNISFFNFPRILQPSIILIKTQASENIGAVVRAMLNFGLTDLSLVSPPDGWFNKDAAAMAAGASYLLEKVKVFNSIKEALHNKQIVFATTSRSRNMVKSAYTLQTAVNHLLSIVERYESRVAFVFGQENSGISNDDLSFVDATIHIPVNPEFASLNLSQSVVVLSYEWTKQLECFSSQKQFSTIDLGKSTLANRDELINFFDHIERELESTAFFRIDAKRDILKRSIRNIFLRSTLTKQEIQILHGVIRSLTMILPEKSKYKANIIK